MNHAYRVMIDIIGTNNADVKRLADQLADQLVLELNNNWTNTDEDNFEIATPLSRVRTSYPLVIPNIEHPTVSEVYEQVLDPTSEED